MHLKGSGFGVCYNELRTCVGNANYQGIFGMLCTSRSYVGLHKL